MSKRIIAMIIAAVLFIFAIASSLFTSSFQESFSKDLSQLENANDLNESTISGSDSSNKIARINVEGVIQDGGGSLFDEGYNHQMTLEALDKVIKSDNIKGVLLVVNSPGGGVYESREIYEKLLKVKEKKKKVYVSMKNMAASGGYYISAPADKIFASNETITGSLGVIMQSMNYKELAEKYGVKYNTIKSGAHKDIMSPTKEMDKEERDILQSLVNESYDGFVQVISDGRHMDKATVKKIADGRIYSGMQAKKLKLIDEIGLEQDALKALKKEIKSDKAEVIEFNQEGDYFKDLLKKSSITSSLFGKSDLEIIKSLVTKRQGLQPMYLYGE